MVPILKIDRTARCCLRENGVQIDRKDPVVADQPDVAQTARFSDAPRKHKGIKGRRKAGEDAHARIEDLAADYNAHLPKLPDRHKCLRRNVGTPHGFLHVPTKIPQCSSGGRYRRKPRQHDVAVAVDLGAKLTALLASQRNDNLVARAKNIRVLYRAGLRYRKRLTCLQLVVSELMEFDPCASRKNLFQARGRK